MARETGGIDAPEQHGDPFLEDQLAGGDLPLRGIGFVVAPNEGELTSAQ